MSSNTIISKILSFIDNKISESSKKSEAKKSSSAASFTSSLKDEQECKSDLAVLNQLLSEGKITQAQYNSLKESVEKTAAQTTALDSSNNDFLTGTDDTATETQVVAEDSGLNVDVSIDSTTMQNFDYNGDGTYDSSELEALQAYIKSEQDSKLDAKIDVDGDGVVEKSEIAAMRAYINAEKEKGHYSDFIQKMEAHLDELEMGGGQMRIMPVAEPVISTTEVGDEEADAEGVTEEDEGNIWTTLKEFIQGLVSSDTEETEDTAVTTPVSTTTDTSSTPTVVYKYIETPTTEETTETEEPAKKSLVQKMLEHKIAKQISELFGIAVPEVDEETQTEIDQAEEEGRLDVAEQQFDDDGDGTLSETETAKMNKYVRLNVIKQTAKDINGDGTIDDIELELAKDDVAAAEQALADKQAAEANPEAEGAVSEGEEVTLNEADTTVVADEAAQQEQTTEVADDTSTATDTVATSETAVSSDDTTKIIEE